VAHGQGTNAAVDAVHRSDRGRIVATLIRLVGDFDVAEAARKPSQPRWIEEIARAFLDGPSRCLLGRTRLVEAVPLRFLTDLTPAIPRAYPALA